MKAATIDDPMMRVRTLPVATGASDHEPPRQVPGLDHRARAPR